MAVHSLVKASLCVAIIAISYVELFQSNSSYGKSIPPVPVPRIRWGVDEPFADYLADRASPVILHNTVVQSWPAVSKWTSINKLSKYVQIHNLDNIFHHQPGAGPIFGPFFDPHRPLGPFTHPINPYELDGSLCIGDMSRVFGEEFEYSCVNESSGLESSYLSGCWHFSGSVMDVIGSEVMIEPLDELLKLNPAISSVNIWIGQRGVTTPCHFDGYHNMYVQMAGTKRFVLYPPSDIAYLRSYPFLHPSYGQCQTPLRLELLHPVIAELGPGDMLYIPPFWAHEVTATSSSISVNVWTSGRDEEIVTKVFEVPLPSKLTSQVIHSKARAQTGACLIFQFLEAYRQLGTSPQSTLTQLLSRYELLTDIGDIEGGFQWPWEGGGVCEHAHRVDGSQALECDDMAGYLSKVVDQMSSLSPEGRDPTTSPWVLNYLEFIIANSIELPLVKHYVLHLRECDINNKW